MIVFSRQLGDNAPNFVEPWNNPTQDSPWVTNYGAGATAPVPWPTSTPTTTTKSSTTKKTTTTKAVTVAAPASTSSASSTKIQIKRTGIGADLLDKLLPLVADQAGTRTIYGLPPIIVYGVLGMGAATLGVHLYRKVKGGGGRRRAVSNPKRRPARPRRRRSKR